MIRYLRKSVQLKHRIIFTLFKIFMSKDTLISKNPYDGTSLGEVAVSSLDRVKEAHSLARAALSTWSRRPLKERTDCLLDYAELLLKKRDALARLISAESGKPLWESQTEVQAMANKVAISIDAQSQRASDFERNGAHTRFHALGVVAVLGPFNFPGHLPNGHIVPALLAGNTILFKPSEQTPLVGEFIVNLMWQAGIPRDVIQLLNGGPEVGQAIAALEPLDGLFFTGSSRAGLALHKMFGGRPQTLLALEMGGNNPLVIDETVPVIDAARVVCQSAFVTAGQRCTCARRLLVPKGDWGDTFIEILIEEIGRIEVGNPLGNAEVYIGTLINSKAAENTLNFESDLVRRGAFSLLPLERRSESEAMLRPGLIDVGQVSELEDAECFGPLLQLTRYDDFDDAIAQCNATAYGLAAGLLSESFERYKLFRSRIAAGIVNWNQPLTGASSSAPFGGVGLSGNHRPSAYFAADYSAHPVASLERASLADSKALPGFNLKVEETIKC
jgi:succinylglutamic semialdehyde dehydrogenase